ncbi:MAG: amidohydrolase family protein [Thermoanaerobaculia bacterium]|nr:amidohydrolase family protein [Thermoanaerobaculia bacterium]
MTRASLVLLSGVLLALPMQAFDPDAWNAEQPEQPGVIVVRGATIWTAADDVSPEDAVLENADLLIRAGVIEAIGQNLQVPSDAVEIDGTGKHVTPGLIDAHSHTAASGGLNEGSNNVTSEVRVADVLNPEDVNLYRQLAGGLTIANVLHGSANAIGGQNAVIKLRWGLEADGLLMQEAPQGIKFALGENPKRSNFRAPEPRYPTTRQGVEKSIREAFEAAIDYRDAHQAHNRALKMGKKNLVPPQRDFQLEALVEIMDGTRLVHAHSYRADEILMLMEVAEDYGFTVATFQHVLEGYKVADELAASGSGASSFSDWWAYKYEVIDAIPHNGAIMWDRDVLVSFNSDSGELARRLNLEAAKAVRWGGVPEVEALKFVTLNPAKQLQIDKWVGSLEPGKHGDFVIWSGHPLSTYSRVEQTWVDGRKYFDRQTDLEARETIAAERQALLQEVRDSGDERAEDAEDTEPDPEDVDRIVDSYHGHPHQESGR